VRRGRSLFRKYALLLVALLGVALLANSLLEMYSSYQANKGALLAIQKGEASVAAARIEQFVSEVERQVTLVAESQAVRSSDLDFARMLRHVAAVTDVSYLDGAGREQLRVSRLDLDVRNSGDDHSRERRFLAPKLGTAYFSPVYFRDGSEPYMTVAVAGSGLGSGVVAAEVNLKFIREVVSRIHVGKAGHAYVVDTSGTLIAHRNISMVLRQPSLSGLSHVGAALAGRTQPDAENAATVGTDVDGRRVLTAHAPIEPLDWLVFLERPLDEAFEPLYASIVRSVSLLVGGLALSVVASLVLARKIVGPIRRLQEGAERIGSGKLDQQISIKTGDELEALADSFNQMATQLRHSYENMEQKVDARTRELGEANEGLTRSVEELRALGEVGQAVSSTLDLHTVLTTIVTRAAQLSGSYGGTVYEFDEATETFHVAASHHIAPEHLEALQAAPIHLGQGAVGQAGASRAPVEIADILDEHLSVAPQTRHILARLGFRSLLALPLVREQRLLGGLVVWRHEAGHFPAEIVNLLKTFAAQSVLAIQNARLFRELEVKGRQLEAASHHKSEFLANMSHELRTPLNAVIGFSDVLLDRMFGDVNEKQDEYLRDIRDSGGHLLSLINDILDLSKIEAGRMELDLTDFDLPLAIQNALILVRERASRRGVALHQLIDEGVSDVRADERKIKQVLLNLLSNAIKFTPEGGRIEVRATRADGMVEIAVSDTGVGIAPEDQEAVFEQFRQVGAGAVKQEGTGLGLTLCRNFVELHGGKIRLQSLLDVGSTITFTIPVHHGK